MKAKENTMEGKIYHGFYSKQHDYSEGHLVYLNPNGEEVIVTCVSKTKEIGETSYSWPDAVYVSEVLYDKLVKKRTKRTL